MEMGESANVTSIKVDPDKYLKAKVIEVSFEKVYDACRSRKVIEAPHWPGPPDGYSQSQKAAVWQLGKEKRHTAKVKLEIDSKGVSGKGKLTGTLGQLVFEGETPLASGTHDVTVTLKETPAALHWTRGQATWVLEGGGHVAMAGATLVELFFVFDDPAQRKFFSEDGVWIEALRFIFKEARLEGTQKITDALGKVTKACFELKANHYDIKNGAANFGGATNRFHLTDYMKPALRKPAGEDYVNCYDQAYAVVVFAGVLGIHMDALFLEPFGFLKLTQLVGRGACNNPFPKRKYMVEDEKYRKHRDNKLLRSIRGPSKPPELEDFLVVDAKDPDRDGFGNHMFCEYRRDRSQIHDACAGPALGTHDRTGYMLESIDTNTPGTVPYYPKTPTDIRNNAADPRRLTDYSRARYQGHIYDMEVKDVK